MTGTDGLLSAVDAYVEALRKAANARTPENVNAAVCARQLIARAGSGGGVPDGWRPIETAPQTSKSRLVWCPERQNIYIVSWRDGEGWLHFGSLGRPLTEEPTDWRPLPDSPTSPDETAGKS